MNKIRDLFKANKLIFVDNSVRPELDNIWSYMSQKRRLPEKPLNKNISLKCLVFKSSHSAVTWNLLATRGIALSDYKDLFNAQHEKDILIEYPELVNCDYDIISKTVRIDPYRIDGIRNRYILGQYEMMFKHCQFCRGSGFIQAIGYETGLIRDDIPEPVYQIECFENSESREKLKRSKK